MNKHHLFSFFISVASAAIVTGCGSGMPAETDNQELAAMDARSTTTVTLDLKKTLAVLSSAAVGANAAAWDANLVDPQVPDLLKDAGLQVLRYPGGSTSDNYHFLTNDVDDPTQGGTTASSNFDAFMSVAKRVGAQAMITVNYGSGTPQEAADWVRYANRGCRDYAGPVPTYPGASSTGHNYGIRYWEVGNELYGDGTYGATWEVNHKAHDPATYASGVVAYSAAMKQADSSIRVGVVLTAPGNWPDGQISDSSPSPWNDTVLPIACAAVDFVVIHWYPQGPTGETDAGLLAAPQNGASTPVSYTPSIPSMIATLKTQLAQYCGAHANDLQITVTETNSVSYDPGKQTTSLVNALYLADALPTWFENGVTNVDWWAIHNSPFDGNVDPSLYGDYEFGEYGILANGFTSANGEVEPPPETPFPAYYGLQMLGRLGHQNGSKLLGTTSSSPLVSAHAVKQPDGSVRVLFVNKDPSATQTVTLKGTSARGLAKLYRYGIGDTSIHRSTTSVHGSFSLALPPYSLTTVQLP